MLDPKTQTLESFRFIHKSSHKPCISLIHDKFKHQNSRLNEAQIYSKEYTMYNIK